MALSRLAAASGSRAFFRQSRAHAGGLSALGAGAASIAAVLLAGESQSSSCEGPDDRLKYWDDKWNKTRQLGFHMDTVNPQLQKFFTDMLPPAENPHAVGMGPRILFPLCGKAVDMAALARKGYRVVGIEGVRKAVDEFAEEHGLMGHSVAIGLPPNLDPGSFRAHAVLIGAGDAEATRSEPPTPVLFIEGDFLKIGAKEAQALVPFEAVFDRGSLVAVNPENRAQYARSLSSLVAPGGRVLLVTVEHDPFSGGQLGPPFEVTEATVKELYSAEFDVKLLSRENRIDAEPTWRKRGATRFEECVYLLTKRQPQSS